MAVLSQYKMALGPWHHRSEQHTQPAGRTDGQAGRQTDRHALGVLNGVRGDSKGIRGARSLEGLVDESYHLPHTSPWAGSCG